MLKVVDWLFGLRVYGLDVEVRLVVVAVVLAEQEPRKGVEDCRLADTVVALYCGVFAAEIEACRAHSLEVAELDIINPDIHNLCL